MKVNILFALLMFCMGQFNHAAYSANDYLFPKLHNQITLKNASGSILKVSHTNVFDTFGNRTNSIRFESKNSLAIKEYKKSVAFLFAVNGQDIELKHYELESTSYFVSLVGTDSKTWFSMPEEAWSTTEHKFNKPTSSFVTQTSKSSFKKVKAKNGMDYFSLIVKVYEKGRLAYTLIFAKDIGLLQYIDQSGTIYENDLWFETLANKFKSQYSSESSMKTASWNYFRRVTAYTKDAFQQNEYNSNRNRLIKRGIDTMAAFYLGLYYKSANLLSFGNYLTSSKIEKYTNSYHNAILKNDDKKLNIEMENYIEWAFYLMPVYSTTTLNSLKKHINNIEKNYKANYMNILDKNIEYLGNKGNYSALSNYEATKMIAYGKLFEKAGSADPDTRENVFNYLAYAHQRLGNKDLDLYYNAKAAKEFANFSDALKLDNIAYAKASIQDIMTKTTKNEAVQIEAIEALLVLKAQTEALEKARKGYNYGFESKKYGFVYGDIALQQKEKMDLRKAIELIEKHPESLTAQDNEKLVRYYKFLGEDDMVKKYEKEKKEQAAIAAKEKAKRDKKNRRKRYGPPFGLAISTNPANLLWNTFPVAAGLRLGKTIHQFRVNNHNGHKSKQIFGNYARDNDIDEKKSW